MRNWSKKSVLFASVTSIMMMFGLSSCVQPQEAMVVPVSKEMSAYEKFVYHCKDYPTVMDVYMDDALLERATSKSVVCVCLNQQRGRLYVDGQVAADWPVSTGADSHRTPTGSYRVRLKEKHHASNRYGRMYNSQGKCIDKNADAFKQPIPEGGRFEGSAMPNWMRLTSDGVGMHTGKVVAGKRLSHGCIRLPHVVSTMLFDIVEYGSRVIISDDVEPNYPVAAILARKELEEAISASEAQPEELPEDMQ